MKSDRAAALGLCLGALLLATILVAPLFLARGGTIETGLGVMRRIPNVHDLEQHLAILRDFDRSLLLGNLYPRWMAAFNNGYGLPFLNYYQPGFFFETEIVRLFFGDVMNALLAVSILNMAACGLAFYWFARLFFSRGPSVLGAALYMIAPYYFLDLYHRAAFPECAAFCFVPLVFGMSYLVGKSGQPRHYAGLALSLGLFFFTHWPSAYLTSLAVAVYVLAWSIVEQDWRIPVRVAAGSALGVLLSAIHWLPAALEAGYITEFWSAAFPYRVSYLPFTPLSSDFVILLNRCFYTEALILLAGIAVLAFAGKPFLRSQSAMLMIAGVFSVFMVTRLSSPVWGLLPKIEVILFAWRWLLPITFFATVAAAALVENLRDRPWIAWAAVALLFAAHLWPAIAVVRAAFLHPDFNPRSSYTIGLFYPRGAMPPNVLPNSPAAMLAGPGSVNILHWDPSHRVLEVTVSEPNQLRLRTYNFPGWQARIDGELREILSDPQGVQVIDLPPGRHRVELSFVNTPARTAGVAVSGVTLLWICGLFLYRSRREYTT